MTRPHIIRILGNGIVEVEGLATLDELAYPGDTIKLMCIGMDREAERVSSLIAKLKGEPDVYRTIEQYQILP